MNARANSLVFSPSLRLAQLSYLAFILNGTLVRNEYLLLFAAAAGSVSLMAHFSTGRIQIPSALRLVFLSLLLSAPIVLVKALYFPVAFVFLLSVSAAIGVALQIRRAPSFFHPRLLLCGILAFFYGSLLLGAQVDEIFAGSRNQVSVILLSMGCLSFAVDFKKKDVVLALMIFVGCLLAVGSGGIISGTILLLAIFASQARSVLVKGLKLVMLVAAAFAMVYAYLSFLPDELVAKLTFDRILGQDVRFQIIQQYLQEYTKGVFLFIGAPDNLSFNVIDLYSFGGAGVEGEVNTLHNSYLSVHAKIGIVALLLYFAILRNFYYLRGNIFLFLLFATLCIRAFSDAVFILDGYYNFVFYYFFILASEEHWKRKRAGASGDVQGSVPVIMGHGRTQGESRVHLHGR